MAIFRFLTVSVFILVSLCVLAYSEIHRTKLNPNKSPNRRKAMQVDSYVALSQQTEGEFNATDGLAEDMSDRIEVWCFSIFGAILVGLSGIFPLLVIPIEAGPALKHGGKIAGNGLFHPWAWLQWLFGPGTFVPTKLQIE